MEKVTKELLYEQYPLIFTESFRGLEVPEGWLGLLSTACATIQAHIDATGARQLVALQVKSKFGGMRFYRMGGNAFSDGVIAMAEAVSRNLCDRCGDRGVPVKIRGWIIVRCTAHLDVDSF